MTMTRRQRMWLCPPPLAACCADVAMTLAGQTARYWSGDYAAVHEFNPVARALLAWHPAAFVLTCALWATFVVGVVLAWRSRPAVLIAGTFFVTFCHAVAAAGWIARTGLVGVVGAVLVLIAVERLLSFCWRRAGVGAALKPARARAR